jgi:hypothetical protein
MVMDLCLVSSSSLLGFPFARLGNERPAALFFLNIGLFVVAFLFVASGVRLQPLLLYTADLYWLNLYVVCLTWYGRTISGSTIAPSPDRHDLSTRVVVVLPGQVSAVDLSEECRGRSGHRARGRRRR